MAELLPHPRAVFESKTAIGEVLGIQERTEEKIPNSTKSPKDDTSYASSEQEREDQPEKRSGELSVTAASKPEQRIEPPPPDVDELDLSHVPNRLREQFRRILKKYSRMWDGTLGEINTTVHRIELVPDTRPIAQAPYRAGPNARKKEDAEIQKMLAAGVIKPAQSEWASPVLRVPKPDGSMRFCVDYRRFFAVTVKDTYPLPRIDECLDSLGDTKVFYALDAISGYWQMPIPWSDRDKTAFSSHSGLYRFSRMPFGLTNSPATFQRAMDILLSPFRWKWRLLYLDDIIIFSKSWQEHIVHVDEILSVLEKAGVKLKLRKCECFVEKIKYLGHVVRPGLLEVDAARTAALEQVRYPQTQTQLRSFLGLCNVHRRFVPHYAKIAHPLNQLLKKGQPAQLEGFDEPCKKAFHKLKGAILAPPVLALPKKDLPYSVDTDASDYQIGAALFQTHPDAQRKPIGFFSRTLAAAERNYSVSEKEFLAVIWAVQTLRPYLYGEHFIVHTDHASLRWVMNVTDPSGRLSRWRLLLSEFDFEIKYKKGKANSQADALSRLLTEGETVYEIDDEMPCFMAEPADATEDEEEDFGRVDDILALEGGPSLIASITSKPSLRRSSFASKPSTPSAVESRKK